MRVVTGESDLVAAVAGARREAGSSFGNDTVFLEKWLAVSRHVEIQILGDLHGNIVHCFERECSIQRRHQKIIEEAPSPAITPELRARMGDAALAAARKLGYASAGTVEFLVCDAEFWFLEVNARLQVEHPVTEAIIGRDLVREQIRIAEGEPLSFTQDELAIDGHAIEARLYAEDPERDFLPSPGRVLAWTPSRVAGAARFDSGVESGTSISTDFDPMIAKVIAHAPTRREAAARLARILETTRIDGPVTNRDFLVATLRTPEYLAGDTTTDFIARVNPARTRSVSRAEEIEAAVAVAIEGQARRRGVARVLRNLPSGWRNSTMPMERITFRGASEDLTIEYRCGRDGAFRMVADGTPMRVLVYECGRGVVDVAIDDRRFTSTVHTRGTTWFVQTSRGAVVLEERPRYPSTGAAEQGGGLKAPMPGAVLKTEVRAGDRVTRGQLLLILEAMKMEHRITAPRDGTVEALHVAEGEQVVNDQLLVTITESEDN